jgi:hypothetical protein
MCPRYEGEPTDFLMAVDTEVKVCWCCGSHVPTGVLDDKPHLIRLLVPQISDRGPAWNCSHRVSVLVTAADATTMWEG